MSEPSVDVAEASPAVPSFFDGLRAAVTRDTAVYRASLLEGKDVTPLLATAAFAKPGVPVPSPEEHAINNFLLAIGNVSKGSTMTLEQSRALDPEPFLSIVYGPSTVTPVPLATTRGVEGYWVSWPGVPTDPSAPTVLFFHGGGMCQGTALGLGGFLDRLSRGFSMRVLSVEYPLYPEHTSEQVNEALVAAYVHLVTDLHVPPTSIVVCGDSGGGNATLLLLQELLRRELPQPAAAWTISPVTSHCSEAELHRSEAAHEFLLHDELMRRFSAFVRRDGLEGGRRGDDPAISPLHGAVRGLAPVYMSWSPNDRLLWEIKAMVDRLRAAEVPVATHEHPHGVHTFFATGNHPGGVDAIARAAAWTRQFITL